MSSKTFNNTKINVEFDEDYQSRTNINSGENISSLFAKIRRFILDLKSVCFSGSYKDLSDTPTTATKDTDGLMSAEDKAKLDGADDTYALKSKYGNTTINVGRKADTTVGVCSTAEGVNTTASGECSHAEGQFTVASGIHSHAEGFDTKATGNMSHAEGYQTKATGNTSHAEGYYTKATGNTSHAEGYYTHAIAAYSHAEGRGTSAQGDYSHTGGYYAIASGNRSFSHGNYAKTTHDDEVAFGKYNISNEDTLFSIGDGTADDARHNAFEITTTGGKLHDKDIATTDLIPSSLPANGGNADYAAVAHDTQLFNGKPYYGYVNYLGVLQVDDMSAVSADVYEYMNDPTYKLPYEISTNATVAEFMGLPPRWWHIKYYPYGYGNGYSCQTAFPVGFSAVPFIRYSENGVWSDWQEIYTSYNKPYVTGYVPISEDGKCYTNHGFTPSVVLYNVPYTTTTLKDNVYKSTKFDTTSFTPLSGASGSSINYIIFK